MTSFFEPYIPSFRPVWLHETFHQEQTLFTRLENATCLVVFTWQCDISSIIRSRFSFCASVQFRKDTVVNFNDDRSHSILCKYGTSFYVLIIALLSFESEICTKAPRKSELYIF